MTRVFLVAVCVLLCSRSSKTQHSAGEEVVAQYPDQIAGKVARYLYPNSYPHSQTFQRTCNCNSKTLDIRTMIKPVSFMVTGSDFFFLCDG